MEIPLHREDLIESRNEDIKVHYLFEGKSLGEGSYGIVRKARRILDGQKFAVKILPKHRIDQQMHFRREIQLMKEVDHPNIVRLNETYEDKRYIYLVMDLCRGGELFDVLSTLGHFSERQTASLFRQMLSAVAYLHSLGIVHRDLKPENFLFSENQISSPLKLIDFGISKKLGPEHTLKTRTGTFYYISPDILKGEYDEKCDIWSLGVILFMLLSGYPPFDGDTSAQILQKVEEAKFEFGERIWEMISGEAKDLISKMLDPEPTTRISAEEALNHPWILSYENIEHAPVKFDFNKLDEYQNSNKFRKAVLNYMATQCSTEELADLIRLFKELDVHNNGMISASDMRNALASNDYPPSMIDEEIGKLYHGNAFINLTEFIAAMMDRRMYLKEEKLWQAFLRFDVHKTGKITASELREVIDNEHKFGGIEVWRKMIEEADLDGDGEISYLDFISMMESANDSEIASFSQNN